MDENKKNSVKPKRDIGEKKQIQDFPGVPANPKKPTTEQMSKSKVQKLSKNSNDGKMDNTEKNQDE